jgi:hypothetical protein
MYLMRNCPCADWVITPDQPKQFTCFLAAVDLIQDDIQRTVIANNEIVDFAFPIRPRRTSGFSWLESLG